MASTFAGRMAGSIWSTVSHAHGETALYTNKDNGTYQSITAVFTAETSPDKCCLRAFARVLTSAFTVRTFPLHGDIVGWQNFNWYVEEAVEELGVTLLTLRRAIDRVPV